MNSELKEKWLRALRSGRYKQTQHTLRKSGLAKTYCCLGVLCNVSKEGKWENNGRVYVVGPNASRNYIPKVLLPKFGITDKTQKKLAFMNDANKMSFEKIADWVEANL